MIGRRGLEAERCVCPEPGILGLFGFGVLMRGVAAFCIAAIRVAGCFDDGVGAFAFPFGSHSTASFDQRCGRVCPPQRCQRTALFVELSSGTEVAIKDRGSRETSAAVA